MSTLNSYAYLTIAEAAKREGYDPYILGELAKKNEFLQEVPWIPAAHGSYHKFLQAARLGTGNFAKTNEPITAISSTASPLVEPVKLYEGDSIVDERVLASADDPTAVRDSEDYMNLEGLTQDWLYQLFYNVESTDPDGFRSFITRRSAVLANRVWDAGGGGGGSVHTSLWLTEFGPGALALAYNKGGAPGFRNEDRGRNLVTAPTGSGQMWAWIRHYEIWAAIVLRDDRALLRYGAIETTGSSNIFDPNTFIEMKNQLPSFGRDAVAWVNRTLKTQIDNDAYDKTNAAYSIREIVNFGPVTMIAGVPVRMHEGITNTEADI